MCTCECICRYLDNKRKIEKRRNNKTKRTKPERKKRREKGEKPLKERKEERVAGAQSVIVQVLFAFVLFAVERSR